MVLAIVKLSLLDFLTSAGCCHICPICGGIQAGMVLQSMRDHYITLHMTWHIHVGEGSIACVCEGPSQQFRIFE